MDEILGAFEKIELDFQLATRTADFDRRYEIVEEARSLYKDLRPCQQRTLIVAFPKWELALRPNIL